MLPRYQVTGLLVTLTFVIGLFGACSPNPKPPPQVSKISVEPSTTILVGETANLTITASGTKLQFEWTADRGSVSSLASPSSAFYTAPDSPGPDTVTVKVTSKGSETHRSISLNIVASLTLASNLTPTETAAATPTSMPTATPVPTDTPIPPTPTPQPVAIVPTDTPTAVPPTDTPMPALPTDTPIPVPPADTPTPEPPTPIPTATPTPPLKSNAVVNAEALNLRSGPGVVYDILGVLKRGNPLKVTGKNPAGNWLMVTCPGGQEGWVAAWLLQINLSLAQVAPVPVPPTPTPICTPTSIATPTPELLPPPIPLEPENGAAFLGEPATLKWRLDRPRAPDEVFSVRVRREGETRLCHHDKADKSEYKGSLSYCTAGTLYWSVALVRDLRPWLPEDDENRWQDLSESSEERWFYYVPGEEPWTWPTPDHDDNGTPCPGCRP